MSGKTLEFEMTDKPNEMAFSEFSKSEIGDTNFVTVLIIEAKDRVFKGTTSVAIKSNTPSTKILYSTDGSEPKLKYKQPFTIS